MTTERVERRLVAIMSADVVGYSRMTAADEEGTLARLRALRADLIDPKIAEHRGRVVKLMGDGILVEFASVVDAVRCAADVQKEMQGRSADLAEDQRIVFRVGINLGDIIIDGEDIQGDGVNIAARLEQMCEPGGICISDDAFRQARGKADVGFEDLGPQNLKNIPEPVRVYRVLLEPEAAGKVVGRGDASKRALPKRWRWAIPAAAALVVIGVAAGVLLTLEPWVERVEAAAEANMAFPLPDKPSIVVLPFDNVGDDPEQAWFADGVTGDIIAHLATWSNLFVIDRTSSFSYQGTPTTVKRVAEELSVRYVLQGSVQRGADNLRVNIQLIDALSGRHIWSERYDRPAVDLFALQDDIVRQVSTALAVNLTEGEQAALRRQGQGESIEAWELSTRGAEFSRRYTKEDNAKARALYEEAITVGGEQSEFLSGIASTLLTDVRWGWSDDPARALNGALALAQQALEIDDTNWSALLVLADHAVLERRFDDAVAFAERAVVSAPSVADVYVSLADHLSHVGRAAEGIPHVERAMRLSPFYPDWYLFQLGVSYALAERYEEALAAYEALAKKDSEFGAGWAHMTTAVTAWQLGLQDKARAAMAEFFKRRPDFSIAEYVQVTSAMFKEGVCCEQAYDTLRALGTPEHPPLPLPDKPSIAVLPFDNLSDDPSQEYFADGMTEDLITDLSKLSGLFVIARNSSFSYKGQKVTVRRVAEDLGVRYVLEGSVRRIGDQVRINTQLIDATTGGHVWAERYDRQLDNIFAVQDEILERVVQALELHLTETEQDQREKGPQTTSLEAYDLVLKARKLMTRFDHKAANEARDLLQRVIEIDPSYAEAHSLLGLYFFDEWRVWGRKRDQNLARALELATQAVELSPSDPAPHVLLALVYQWRREFDKANAAADKALALQPNDAITLGNLGSMLGWAGRNEEALGVLQQAIRLDPFHPPNYLEWLAAAYQGVGDYGLCVEAANRGIALYPDYVGLYVDLAGCYAALGREEEAQAAAAEILRTKPRFTLKAFAAYAPYSDQRDLQQEVKLLRKAGVPESADEVFRVPDGRMTGDQIRAAISGQTFVDTLPARFAGTINTFDPSGTMNGHPQSGSPAEQFGNDQGKWWIEGDRFCRKWNRWVAGRTGCFSFLPDGDSIKWINRYGEFHSEMKKVN